MRVVLATLVAAPVVVLGVLAGAVTAVTAATPPLPAGPPVAGVAVADIPPDLVSVYESAASTCPGLDWTVLAAIGKIESNHGQSTLPGVHSGRNSAGAGGPMQFLASTWAAYGVDGNHDGVADRYNPVDAIYGAAHYLCANGAGDPRRLRGAIFRYNHADWYVNEVLRQAASYLAAAPGQAMPPG
jgi:soluble lytic murein transglycosylase-like protein